MRRDRDLDNNNKGTLSVVDKDYLNRLDTGGQINSDIQPITLYPVSDILTTEFRGLQLLHHVELEMKKYNAFKSLLLLESSYND